MRLQQQSIEWAIASLNRHGDTDLFPRPVELEAVVGRTAEVAAELSSMDLSGLAVGAARRFIVPKDDFSYRAATQLDLADSIILTALVYELGNAIEKRRRPASDNEVFSYRFSPSTDGDLFSGPDPWHAFWTNCLATSASYSHVLLIDIADFYNQIYHHTVENQLIESGFPNQATKWILRLLESVTAKVSRGIPVGPHPVHLIAEATLIPVDNSLASRDAVFRRFVDDIVVFAQSDTEARRWNLDIAGILDKQQRLQLQRGKTRLLSREEFQEHARAMLADRPINDLEKDLLAIIRKYSGGNPYRVIYLGDVAQEDLAAFTPAAIETIISEYLSKAQPDFVRLRWFIRRLSQVGHPAAVELLLKHFERLVPAMSEICHYFVAVGSRGGFTDWPGTGERLLEAMRHPVVESSEYFQMSILSLFGREPRFNHVGKLISRFDASSPFARREIVIAAASGGASDWLRELKETVGAMDMWTRRAYLWSAKKLPAEERKFFLKFADTPHWLDNAISKWAQT